MNWKTHLRATTTMAERGSASRSTWNEHTRTESSGRWKSDHDCCGSQSRAPLLISSCALRTKCAMLVAALLGAVTFARLADQLIPADGSIDYYKH